MPEFNYGVVNYGVIAACLIGLFIFLYFMQGHVVSALSSMVVVYAIISGIAFVFYADNSDAFRSKYLLLTVLIPLVLAVTMKAIKFAFALLPRPSLPSSRKKSSSRSSKKPVKANSRTRSNSRDDESDYDDEEEDDR